MVAGIFPEFEVYEVQEHCCLRMAPAHADAELTQKPCCIYSASHTLGAKLSLVPRLHLAGGYAGADLTKKPCFIYSASHNGLKTDQFEIYWGHSQLPLGTGSRPPKVQKSIIFNHKVTAAAVTGSTLCVGTLGGQVLGGQNKRPICRVYFGPIFSQML